MDDHYYVEDHEDGTLRANGQGGQPRIDKQPLLVTQEAYSIVPDENLVVQHEVAPTLQGRRGKEGGAMSHEEPLVAYVSENQRAEVLETPYAHQLTSGGGKPGQGYPMVRQEMAVRRLTPLECERLQGMEDNWSAPDELGGPGVYVGSSCQSGVADGKRYAALGDAVTVTVARWLGDAIAREERA